MSDHTQMSKDFYVGKTLQGNYLIERLVGKGGMAWVYKATHTKFNEPMAIKILLPHICEEPEVRRRFLEEARIQFRLKHQSIVQVTDIIEDGALIAIIMEWVPGDNLKQLLKKLQTPISRKDLWRIMGPILDAVGYAHRQGLVHRDIKPANILLHTEGERLMPKIADFGIAKILDETLEDRTATGITMGTLKFMPPEQIRDSKRVDHRADIYALGATLYVMATRRLPFLGKGDWVIYQQLNEDPPPPSSFNPSLSDAFDHVVLTCMDKKPENRYQSCAELAQALSLALLDPQNIKRLSTQEINSMEIYNLLAALPEENSVYSSSMELVSPGVVPRMPNDSSLSITNPFAEVDIDDKDNEGTDPGTDTGSTGSQTNQANAPTDAGSPAPDKMDDGPSAAPYSASQSSVSLPGAYFPEEQGPSANALVFRTAGFTILMMVAMLLAGALVFKLMESPTRRTKGKVVGKKKSIHKPLKPAVPIDDPTCKAGQSRPCYNGPAGTKGKGACKAGTQTCQKNGTWSRICKGQQLPQEERCNGQDDNCDGQIDEAFANKGKSCFGKWGDCRTSGTYVCSRDKTKLTCASSGKVVSGKGAQIRLKISPSRVRFRLSYRGRTRSVRGKYCIELRSRSTLTFYHRRYYKCVFSLPKRSRRLFVKLDRVDPMGLSPSKLSYCKK